LGRVSKDGLHALSWFETAQERLLTMRAPLFKHASRSRSAVRPSFVQNVPPEPEGAARPSKRGRGECRVPDAPAASCAHGSEKCARVFTASSPESPGIPARNGFTVYFVISPAISCFATVASRIKVLSGPVEPNEPPQDLTPASRRQDHTTSPYASAPSSCVPEIAHGEQSALRSHRTPDAAASTASHPASVTIAIRPSCGTRRL
jgi:hypothetical protein